MDRKHNFLEAVTEKNQIDSKSREVIRLIDLKIQEGEPSRGITQVRVVWPINEEQRVAFDFFNVKGLRAMSMSSGSLSRSIIFSEDGPTLIDNSLTETHIDILRGRRRDAILSMLPKAELSDLYDFLGTYQAGERRLLEMGKP